MFTGIKQPIVRDGYSETDTWAKYLGGDGLRATADGSIDAPDWLPGGSMIGTVDIGPIKRAVIRCDFGKF